MPDRQQMVLQDPKDGRNVWFVKNAPRNCILLCFDSDQELHLQKLADDLGRSDLSIMYQEPNCGEN